MPKVIWNKWYINGIRCDIRHNGYFRFIYRPDTGKLEILYNEDMGNSGFLEDKEILMINKNLSGEDLEEFVLYYISKYMDIYDKVV